MGRNASKLAWRVTISQFRHGFPQKHPPQMLVSRLTPELYLKEEKFVGLWGRLTILFEVFRS